jgi:CubicO group peptidase (beta-lactamase class C family)
MKATENTKLQFQALRRQFLFRAVDLEVLSGSALGDSNKLLGQFATLLIFFSLILSLGVLGAGDADTTPYARFASTLSMEHFLVSTTMLVVGVFAVLSWDSIFPDRRDVLMFAPLPVRTRTIFLAKLAATATALALVVVLLNGATGLGWPLAFAAEATSQQLPSLRIVPAQAPISAAHLQPDLDHALKQALTSGWLAPGTGDGLAIGVVEHGVRRVFAYGAAKPDSLFEIGSITKPFTGLMLARMVAQGNAKFDEPVRALLPAGTVAKPAGREITLLDLATHHSGLPRLPDNFPVQDTNSCSAYSSEDLYGYLARHGVKAPADPSYLYSNLGFGLLGQALAVHAGMSYANLLQKEVTGPLALKDTVVYATGEQKKRFLQGFDEKHDPVRSCAPNVLVGDGGIRSSAGDILTFLEANLHPEKFGSMASALEQSHELRANAPGGVKIALAWAYRPATGIYWHDGATAGFTSYAFFDPRRDNAAVVLQNLAPNPLTSPYLIAEHIRERLSGEPAISLDATRVLASSGFTGFLRWLAAYWFTMLAAGAFIYCGLLSVQGFAAQLLPRRLFLRVSGLLQLAAFCSFVSVYFLQPPFSGIAPLAMPETRRLISWLPSYWFVGLFHELNGSMYPPLAPLAWRAWMALAVSVAAASVAYALCYMRTLRQIAEEADITSGPRGFSWLPRFGNGVQTAIGQFAVRTLARSRQHRLILAFYLGTGLAVTIMLVQPLTTNTPLREAPASDTLHHANSALLTASIVMTVLAVLGTRVVFALPLELRSNWIFRALGVRYGPEVLTSVRRALLLLSVAPVWLVSAVACLRIWPVAQAAAHLAVLGLLGIIVVDVALWGFRKIPFTCSYLPGKSQAHMVFLGACGLGWIVAQSAIFEQKALQTRGSMAAVLVLLSVAAFAVRRHVRTSARSGNRELQFEEAAAPAVLELGLFRDGSVVGTRPRDPPST